MTEEQALKTIMEDLQHVAAVESMEAVQRLVSRYERAIPSMTRPMLAFAALRSVIMYSTAAALATPRIELSAENYENQRDSFIEWLREAFEGGLDAGLSELAVKTFEGEKAKRS